jgi:predicted phage terminase large subunit-like protein
LNNNSILELLRHNIETGDFSENDLLNDESAVEVSETKLDLIRKLQAADELNIRHARNDLLSFCIYVEPSFDANWHHARLSDTLCKVRDGEITRLMVNMPPRFGKSWMCSVFFPLWCWGKFPKWKVVQAGYSMKLARKHSKDASTFFYSDNYRRIFEDAKQTDGSHTKLSVDDWENAQGGSYQVTSIGGTITGLGYHLGILDDPIKDRQEAESAQIQDTNVGWYGSTFYTRRDAADARIVIPVTRWAVGDLAGTLLKKKGKDIRSYENIVVPAVDENGKSNWQSRFSDQEMASTKAELGRYEWSSLFMQRPYIQGGNRFDMERVNVHTNAADFPTDARYYRFWDLASTKKERNKKDPDYTAGVLAAVTLVDSPVGPLEHLWIKDIIYGQWEKPQRDKFILAGCHKDGAGVRLGIETVAGYKDTYTEMNQLLKGKYIVEEVNVSKDKTVRAGPLEPIFEAGNVHILKAEWNEIFTKQFKEFPSGDHDDIVDSVAGAYEKARPNTRLNIFGI